MQKLQLDEVMAKPQPSLWDRAYDLLRSENAQLLKKFEKILDKELEKAHGQQTSNSRISTSGEADYQGNLMNSKDRHSNLQRIIEYNLEHMSDRRNAVRERLGQAAEIALWAKDWMKLATQASPEAAVAWTAICVALPLLTRPSQILDVT